MCRALAGFWKSSRASSAWDETPRIAIQREILEETGFFVERLEPIASFYLSPGGSSERSLLFYAEVESRTPGARSGGLEEEGEDIEVVEMPFEKAWDMLEAGHIVDAKTIIALQWIEEQRTASPRAGFFLR